MYEQCYRDMAPIAIDDNNILTALKPDADSDLTAQLSKILKKASGQNWSISVSNEVGETLRDKDTAKKQAVFDKAQKDPIIEKILEGITGAKLVEVKEI